MRPEDHRRPASPAPHTAGKTIRWARLYDLGTTLLSFGQLAALHRRIVELAGIEGTTATAVSGEAIQRRLPNRPTTPRISDANSPRRRAESADRRAVRAATVTGG
jgi:hypothetical protein